MLGQSMWTYTMGIGIALCILDKIWVTKCVNSLLTYVIQYLSGRYTSVQVLKAGF